MKPNTPGHRVLVKPDNLEEFDPVYKSAKQAGIVLTDSSDRQERTAVDTGVVIQVGPTAFDVYGGKENWCKVGDRISYARYGGKFVTDPDSKEQWLVLNDEDVVMVWEKNNE